MQELVFDFLISVVFISLNLVMILNSYNLIEFYYEKSLSEIDKIIISFIIFFAKIYFILFVLGIIGCLNYQFILISILLIEAINSFVYFKVRNLKFPQIDYDYSVIYKEPYFLIILVFVFSIYIYSFLKGFIFPPKDWDSIWYHLPAAVNWLKTGSLWSIQSPYGYYPFNGALLSLWLIIPFNNDVIVNCQNLIPLVLCFLVIYEINKFFVKRDWNLWIIISLFSVFIIRFELHTQLNDVLVLTFFCIVLYGISKYHQMGKTIFIVVSGIALGILFGLKYNMIAFSILIFFPLFEKRDRNSVFKRLRNVLIVFLLCIMLGSFWYIRNWIVLGDPFYPLALSTEGVEMVQRSLDNNLMRYSDIKSSTLLANIFKPEMWYFAFLNVSKAGIIFILLIPIIVFSFFKILRAGKYELNYSMFFLFYYCLIVLITPTVAGGGDGNLNMIKDYHNIVRYGLISFYLILLIGLYILSRIKKTDYIQLVKLIIAFSSIIAVMFSLPGFIINSKYNGLILFILLLVSLIIIMSLKLIDFRKMNLKLTICLILFLSVSIIFIKNYKDTYRNGLYDFYYNKQIKIYDKSTNLFTWCYKNIKDKKIQIYDLRSYPFYGIDFENDILFESEKNNFKDVEYIIVGRYYPNPYSSDFGELHPVHKRIKDNVNFELVYFDDLANVYMNKGNKK